VNELPEIIERLAELESQSAFQEELHERLNQVVARQDRELAKLKAQVQELAVRLRDIGEAFTAGVPGSADEVPPHY
jgi:SlyX protein